VRVEEGRYIASQVRDARYVELPGADHDEWMDDSDSVLAEVEEFVTGVRPTPEPDRVLATVLFADIVGSTERAAELGDHAWRDLLESHHAAVRRELARFRGREIDSAGDAHTLLRTCSPALASSTAAVSAAIVARAGRTWAGP
jgi:class 3 adenylate cyclase